MRSVTVGDDSEVIKDHRLHSEDDVLGDLENEIDQEVNRKSKDKGRGGQEVDVKVNKKEATYFSMSAADKDELAELIARKIIGKQNEAKERKEAKEKLEEIWDEGTDFLSCRVCAMFK